MGQNNHGVSTSTTAPTARGASQAAAPTTTRPKIRIIHIIAPEIIKTDVANFRDLVQRLTGKPACASTAAHMATTAPPVRKEEEEKKEEEATKKRPAPAALVTTERSDFAAQQEPAKKRKIKCEVKVEEGGFGDYYDLDRSDLWMDLNPGGFLSFLEKEADVFQGLAGADDFLLPLGSSRLDLLGEMYAS
jgi:hypothetical protein